MQKALRKKIRIPAKRPKGVIEQITSLRIVGWLLDGGAFNAISVSVAGKAQQLPILRTERQDVAGSFGTSYHHAGFEAAVPLDLQPSLKDALERGLPLTITAGGKALTSLPTAAVANAVTGHIDRVDRFVIEGWAAHNGQRPKSVALTCGGRVYALSPIWQERADAAESIGAQDISIGFQAELPGYLWDDLPESAQRNLAMYLQVDGQPVGEAIEVSQRQVIDWITTVCRTESEDQYRMLCAIEHVSHGRMSDSLPAPIRLNLSRFAARFGLDRHLVGTSPNTESLEAVAWHTSKLWRALRELNGRLAQATNGEALWQAFLDVAEDLPRQVRAAYYDSIVPTLCRNNLYDHLLVQDDIDIARWLGWTDATDPWQLTISLPAWTSRRRPDKGAAILWRLAEHLHRGGWINTECLHYAAQQVMAGFSQGRFDHAVTDKFIYAYLGVLDAFKGEWHSRLYDEALMGGAIRFLGGFDRYSDYLRRDLARALLKHYGLIPLFWQRIEAYADLIADDPLWQQARRDAALLCDWVADKAPAADMLQLLAVLRRYDSLGNPDARRYAREWLGPRMDDINRDGAHPGSMLLDFLLEEPTEGVRYAAFPLQDDSTLPERHPACGPAMFDTLRGLTQRHKDHAFARHRAWGRRIAGFANQLDKAPARAEVALQWQQWMAEADQGDHLALDLASWLAVHPNTGLDTVRLTGILIDVLGQLPENMARLPAPLLAAWGRLLSCLPTHIVKDVASLLASKCPSGLPASPQKGALALQAKSGHWPGDTLVVIYSCRKYLGSRIAAIRDTWVNDLKARGIPYVILVGDGQDALEGDVLALDVSDRYEDLPQKTLKLVDWVYEHTDFQYLYKIDDDCYLDVARFFENLSYRKHHYYGRVIKRGEGSMDRAWHQSKSHTEHAQKTLDKSPEPSVYADGGGGWVLSREAMRALREARATESGQRLVAVSLMEDKLVGDLVALAGIAPSDEEYESYQRRRTFSAAVPVGMVENLFYPTEVTPTVMCHLDTERDHVQVRALRECRELWPKKIWKSCDAVRLDLAWSTNAAFGSNQLELLSSGEQLQALLAQPPYVVAVMRNEMTLLPHFLEHYRALGVRCFLIADNASDDGTREYLLAQPDVALFSVDTEYKHSHYGVAWQQAILGNFCLGQWVVLADADELLVYPGCEQRPLGDFLAEIESEDADAVRLGMIDMYPYGDLAEADFTQEAPFAAAPWFDREALSPWRLGSGYYSNATSHTSALRHRSDLNAEPNAFTSVKTALVRYQPWMRFSKGLHDAVGVTLSADWAWFAHFKYHAGFKEKVETEILRGQHFDNAKEYRRYQAMLAEGKGSFGAKDISRCYQTSQDFQQLIQGTFHE